MAAEEKQHFLDEADEAAAPERQCIAHEELEEIGRRLRALPLKCQQAFVMRTMLERPVKEIAEENGNGSRSESTPSTSSSSRLTSVEPT